MLFIVVTGLLGDVVLSGHCSFFSLLATNNRVGVQHLCLINTDVELLCCFTLTLVGLSLWRPSHHDLLYKPHQLPLPSLIWPELLRVLSNRRVFAEERVKSQCEWLPDCCCCCWWQHSATPLLVYLHH